MTIRTPQLLGFDARIAGAAFLSQRWPDAASRQRLLGPGVTWPMSVDREVWPSYFLNPDWFDPELNVSIESYLTERGIISTVRTPRFLGLHLWSSLAEMLVTYAREKRDGETPGIVIAVSLERVEDVPGQQWTAVLDPQVEPDQVAPAWGLLGYDVADQFLVSLVSNIPSAMDIAAVRREFGERLNDRGLFPSVEAATAYAASVRRALPDWTPPCVVALHHIRL